MTIRFACGHAVVIDDAVSHAPVCLCGETRVSRVIARPPTFRGVCQGPHAQTEALGAVTVNAAPAGALDRQHG